PTKWSSRNCHPCTLHSFPTRRSSDLEHDAGGSAIRVDHRRGVVLRRLAGEDPEVNEEWITDKDRFAFTWQSAPDRLTTPLVREPDRKSTRLNSSHVKISYAVFCLKKK